MNTQQTAIDQLQRLKAATDAALERLNHPHFYWDEKKGAKVVQAIMNAHGNICLYLTQATNK